MPVGKIKVLLFPEGHEDVKRAMQSVSLKAAKITAAAAAAGAAVLAFAKQAADTVDELGKMSQKVGVSVESLSALKHAASISDVSLESLGTGLRQLSKNMADTQAGTGEAKDAFRALGMDVVDSQGKLKGTEAQLLELADRFSQMEDGAGKTALAMRIFGRAGADLIPLLNEGRAGIEEARKEAERLGIVFSTEAAKSAEVFNDNLTKLQSGIQGFTIQLAGPFVKAFSEATTAMLNAQKQGESFFRVISEGLAKLAGGGDTQRWEREMADAGDALIRAQNKLDQAMNVQRSPGMKGFGDKLVEEARREVEMASAEIARLSAIGPVLAPEQAPAVGAGGKAGAPSLGNAPDEAALKAQADAYLKEFAIMEEARKLGQEFEVAEHARKLEAERILQEQRNQILIDAYDREQAEAIAHGEVMLQIDAEIEKQKQAQKRREVIAQQAFMDNLAGLMNTGSKKMFEIGKAAALAQAGIKGASAVMSAWEAGMSVGGPWAPIVAAAYAAAAGINALNLMNNIRNQQFGGGGGVPTHPTQGASNVSPAGAGGGSTGGGPSTNSQTTVLQPVNPNDLFTGQQIIELINNATKNGGRLTLASN